MILFDSRWSGPHGIGRFSSEIEKRIPDLVPMSHSVPLLHPLEPLLLAGAAMKAKGKAKAYFSPGFNPPLWAPMPVVFTIHDLIHLRFESESSAAKKLYYQTVVRPNVRRAAKVLTVSEFSKKEIVEWAGIDDRQVQVVGNGVGSEFAPDGTLYEPGYPYILYVGNRKPHKNIPRLLEAYARSGLANDVRLLMSGEPDSNIASLCSSLNLGHEIVFAGRISDEDLPSYYRGALGLVLPSLYEGFGLPGLEAAASGIPVLISNITAMPEVLDGAAFLVDPYDTDSIASGLLRMVEDLELRRELRTKGLARARLFSWEGVSSLITHSLNEIL